MEKIDRDKILHLVAGVFLGFFGSWLALVLQCKYIFLSGFLLAVVVGAMKELVWDMLLKKGRPELLDFIFTLYGGFIMAFIIKVITYVTL